MLGDLLKQLFPALGRFVGYHAARLFRKQPAATPSVERSAPIGTTPNVAEGQVLADNAGLDAEFERPVQWACRRSNDLAPEVKSNELYKLWKDLPGGHKWTHYFSVYQTVFGPIHAQPLRILEIGVFHGASLKLWRKYFEHPETIIVGIDITPGCMAYEVVSEGIRVRIGSQTDAAFLRNVVKEFGPFDLIIDDGSHQSSHIIASFNHLFIAGLKESGIYFVEDLHANYWLPWRDSRKSFLDVCKELIEHMNAHYRSAPPSAFLVAQPSDQPNAEIPVPLITTLIDEMRFFDSIVAIYKKSKPYVPHYLMIEEAPILWSPPT